VTSRSETSDLEVPPTNERIALVTGAGQRIGRAIALGLARAGWDVAVHYLRSSNDADSCVAEIRRLGRRALAVRADLTSEEEVLALLSQVTEGLGEASCVVNCAARFDFDEAANFTVAHLDAQMHVNLCTPVLLARELRRRRRALGYERGAVVVNLLDQKLFNPNPDFLSYTLSKAALSSATTLLAQALAPHVRVVAVAPGITLPAAGQSPENFAQAHANTPLGRSSDVEDVVDAVCYLVRAKAVTGTTLIVDGGQHLVPSERDIMFLPR
jgi:NAD(P)-dependent dehydrogenase (short-subunit alcohol dehydrogenase family)